MKHQVIATWICEEDESLFTARFAAARNTRLLNARVQAVDPAECDALLLTGGCDVGAACLRQPIPDPSLVRNDEPGRDEWEFPALATADRLHLPVFAICRGMQVLNIFRGGTLHLDIPGHTTPTHENTQPIQYESGVAPLFRAVNSEHHQAVDQLGDHLIVEARCPRDGVVEQVRAYNGPFCLGVQFHPERDELYQLLFDEFIAAIG